jgi:thiaminase
MIYCEQCKRRHFPIELYTKWIREYAKSKRMQKQVSRWEEVVSRHERT